jgi:hypothetical protein
LDIIGTSNQNSIVSWHKNLNGLGTFSNEKMIGYYANNINSLGVGDLNNDGTTDVFSITEDDDKIAWHKNTNGIGDFSEPQSLILKSELILRNGTLNDIDNDGDLDIVYSTLKEDNQEYKINWRKNINGNFDINETIYSIIAPSYSYLKFRTCDFDNDGDIDIVFKIQHNNLYLMKNNGGLFSTPVLINSNSSTDFHVYDMDNDGDFDFITTIGTQNGTQIAWYENNNTSSYIEHILPILNQFTEIYDVVDLNNDGNKDILYVSSGLKWIKNNGNGTYSQPLSINSFNYLFLKTADLDNDGFKDIIYLRSNGVKMAYLKNNNGVNFNSPVEIYNNVELFNNMVFKDMDGDGDLDIIASSSQDDVISWFKNNGTILQNDSFNLNNFVIYPNPVHDILYIKSVDTFSNLKIYNQLGQLVKTFDNATTLNISDLSSGIYFLQFIKDDILVYNEKIIINRK